MSMDKLPTNPSESTKRRNPHLYSGLSGLAAISSGVKTRDSEVVCTTLAKTGSAKRIRQSSKPLMNKLETEYFDRLKRTDGYDNIRPQAMRFKLGNGIWFKVDFTCNYSGQLQAIEVKGSKAFRGGFENLKVAAALYPEWKWLLVWKNEFGCWHEQTVLP